MLFSAFSRLSKGRAADRVGPPSFLLGAFAFFLTAAQPVRGESLEKVYQKLAPAIPRAMIEKGRKDIGDLNLLKLVQDMQGIQWKAVDGAFVSGSGEARTGGVYLVEEKVVYVNTGWQQVAPDETIHVSALHEALGAMGYLDENYELSTTLYLSSLPRDRMDRIFPQEFLARQERRFEGLTLRRKNPVYLADGGGTSVGGGGDGIALNAKIMCLMAASAFFKSDPKKYGGSLELLLDRIMNAAFEIQTQVTHQEVEIQSDGRGDKVRIPWLRWINGHIQTGGKRLSADQMDMVSRILSGIMTTSVRNACGQVTF